MEIRASYVVVGAVVLALLAGLVAFSLWLVDAGVDRNLARYEIAFAGSVSGLPDGGQVLYRGIPVGRVADIRIDPANGKIVPTEQGSIVARAGAAPRHLAFHPTAPYAYQCNEIDSTVTTFGYDAATGRLDEIEVQTTLPAGFAERNSTAEIQVAPSGRFVYVSNRGHNSIAIFAVDAASGKLTSVGWESTQGKQPRFFALDPAGHSATLVTTRFGA